MEWWPNGTLKADSDAEFCQHRCAVLDAAASVCCLVVHHLPKLHCRQHSYMCRNSVAVLTQMPCQISHCTDAYEIAAAAVV